MTIEELKKQYLREKFLIERRIGYRITTSFERWLEIKNMQDKNNEVSDAFIKGYIKGYKQGRDKI